MVVSRTKKKTLIVVLIIITTILIIINPWTASATSLVGVADYTPHRDRCGAATAPNGKIYAFGGYSSGGCSDILEYDPSTNTVTNIGSFEENKAENVAVTANNGKIYVFSNGFNGNRKNITIFDPDTKSIQELGSFYPTITYRPSAVLASNGMIYVFGCDYNSPEKVYKFNPNNNTLTNVGTLPSRLYFSSAATGPDGNIYIFGGVNKSTTNNVKDIIKFDPSTNTAVKVAEMPYANSKSCAALKPDNGNIYIIGGDGGTYNVVEFNPSTNTTSIVGNSSIPVIYASAAVSNGNIYVLGPGKGSNSTFVLSLTFSLLPPQLSIDLQNDTDAVLMWSGVSAATSYIVEKSTDGSNFTQLAEVTGTTYTDASLPPGFHYYRVKAKNSSDTSQPSNVVTATIQGDPEAPVLSVALDDNNANLSWTTVTGANYILEKSTDGINFSTLTQTSNTSYTDPSLAEGTYYYRVFASNENGTSISSNIVSVTVHPGIPSMFWVFWPPGGQYVEVDWDRGDVDLSGDMVQLWREDTISGIWVPVKDITESEKSSFIWMDTNVTSGLNYKYQVRVYDPSSWDWRIAAESDWAVLDRPFQAPGGLRVTSTTDTSATITWVPISGATEYQINVSTDGGESWDIITVSSNTGTVTRPCMVQVMAGTHARSQWSGILRVQ